MPKLFVLYDPKCEFCRRCRGWLEKQPSYLDLHFIASHSEDAHTRFPGIETYEATNELIVVSEEGAVYHGPPAFIMCLYALIDFREWSLRLSRPTLLPFAREMFDFISHNRAAMSKWLRRTTDDQMAQTLGQIPPVICGNESASCLLDAKRKTTAGLTR